MGDDHGFVGGFVLGIDPPGSKLNVVCNWDLYCVIAVILKPPG